MVAEYLLEIIVNFIAGAGYAGIAVLMALESMIFPVPSEAVMPFAGFLIADGKFSFAGVVFFSTLGSLIGSLISYYLGRRFGKSFVNVYGKYFFLNKHHLDLTEKYFKKRGEITVFICRFIPVVRHLISIPAGIGRMNIIKFSIYTTIGAGIWNAFLTYVGFALKNNWQDVLKYISVIDVAIIICLASIVGYYLYKHLKRS